MQPPSHVRPKWLAYTFGDAAMPFPKPLKALSARSWALERGLDCLLGVCAIVAPALHSG